MAVILLLALLTLLALWRYRCYGVIDVINRVHQGTLCLKGFSAAHNMVKSIFSSSLKSFLNNTVYSAGLVHKSAVNIAWRSLFTHP